VATQTNDTFLPFWKSCFDGSIVTSGGTESTENKWTDLQDKLDKNTSKQDFQNGRKVSFVCVATGYPAPSYYWLQDGELLIPNDRIKIKGSKLTIQELKVQ
jgi:hypothetical protein